MIKRQFTPPVPPCPPSPSSPYLHSRGTCKVIWHAFCFTRMQRVIMKCSFDNCCQYNVCKDVCLLLFFFLTEVVKVFLCLHSKRWADKYLCLSCTTGTTGSLRFQQQNPCCQSSQSFQSFFFSSFDYPVSFVPSRLSWENWSVSPCHTFILLASFASILPTLCAGSLADASVRSIQRIWENVLFVSNKQRKVKRRVNQSCLIVFFTCARRPTCVLRFHLL